jgi:multidrug efflux pump subunit AcrB
LRACGVAGLDHRLHLLALLIGIPAAVAMARIAFPGREAMLSLLTAPLLLPSIVLGLAILKAPKADPAAKPAGPGPVLRAYTAFLTLAMRGRWITIAFTIGMFCVAIYAAQFVPRQFFPSSDRTELLVDITLPQNSSILASEQVARRLDAALADVADDLSLWFHAEDAGAQPFSGGVLDSWPARYVAIFEACRQEDRAVTAFLQSERAPRG